MRESSFAVATTIAFRPWTRGTVNDHPDHPYSGLEAERRFVLGATALGNSLDNVGSRVDRIAITAYISEASRETLRGRAGWCVLDASERRGVNGTLGMDMARYFHPVFTQQEAQAAHRPYILPTHPPRSHRPQARCRGS